MKRGGCGVASKDHGGPGVMAGVRRPAPAYVEGSTRMWEADGAGVAGARFDAEGDSSMSRALNR